MVVPAVQDNVDPAKYDNDPHGQYSPEFASTLIQYKTLPSTGSAVPGPGDIVPGLATTWKKTKAGMIFKLRAAKDTEGNVLTAQDIKYSITRDIALKDGTGEFLLATAGVSLKNPVTVLGKSTVRIDGTMTPLALASLADYPLGVIDEKVAKEHATKSDPWSTKWLADHSDSFGAYYVSSFGPSSTLILKANPNYWGAKPDYSTVIMRAVPTSSSRVEAVESGQAQLALQPQESDYNQAKKAGTVQDIEMPDLAEDELFLNNADGPLKSALVRNAISLGIDRQAILTAAYGNTGKVATGIVPSSFPDLPAKPPMAESVTKAKADLTKAGYPHGFTLTLAVNAASFTAANDDSVASLIKTQLARIGITVAIHEVASVAEFQTQIFSPKSGYEAWLFSDRATVADGPYVLSLTFWHKGLSDSFGYNNSALDKIIPQALAAPIGPKRSALFEKGDALVSADMPTVPLIQTNYLAVAQKGITGFTPNVHDTVLFQYLTPPA